MFTPERNQVLLIQKDRPDWQVGKYNGIGGKIELGELPLHAMLREFEEEVGICTLTSHWEHFATTEGENCRVHCFRAFSDKVHDYQQMESEVPQLLYVPLLNEYPTVPNVQWLVPMALSTNELFTINCKKQGVTNA